MPATVEQFGKALVASGLITADELRALWATLGAATRPKDGDGLARLLVERGRLTDFQAQLLLEGRAAELVLGEYTILAEIGAGGMGQVYKAQHRRMGRVVALKVMSPAAVKDEASVKRFQREVRAAARLEHPNIVAAYDAGQAGKTHFLVMEFVDGLDLAALLKKEATLSVARSVEYIAQAAQGLAYAHGEGVVHRDIKPANLLVDKKRVVKVLDMGLAQLDAGDDGLTGTEQVMGTVDYMSPEQATNTKFADARSDIYSLGCTFWFLLTGKKLYEGASLIERIMQHREAPLPSLIRARDDVPWPLEQIFHKLVAKRAADRFPSMQEVVDALEPYRESSGSGSHGGNLSGGGSTDSAEFASFIQAVGGPKSGFSPTKPAGSTKSGLKSTGSASHLDVTQAMDRREVETAAGSGTRFKAAGEEQPASLRDSSQAHAARPRKRLLLAGCGGAVLAAVLGIGVFMSRGTRDEAAESDASAASTAAAIAATQAASVKATPVAPPGFWRLPKNSPGEQRAVGLVAFPARLDDARNWQVDAAIPRGNSYGRAAWTADGKKLGVVLTEPDTRVAVFERNVAGLKLQASLPLKNVIDFAWSGDGKQLVLSRRGRTLETWRLEGNSFVRSGSIAAPVEFAAGEFNWGRVAWSGDGRWIAACGQGDPKPENRRSLVILIDAATGQIVHTFDARQPFFAESVTFDPTSTKLAQGGQRHLHIWNLVDRSPLFADDTVVDYLYSFAWSGDGKILFAGGSAAVRAVDVAAKKNLWLAEKSESPNLQLTPDERFVLAKEKGGPFKAYDAKTGAADDSLGSRLTLSAVYVSRSGGELVELRTTTDNDTINLVDVATGSRKPLLFKLPQVKVLCYSPTGRRIAAATNSGALYLLNADGTPGSVIPLPGYVTDMAFHPEGRVLAAAGQSLTMWDLSRPAARMEKLSLTTTTSYAAAWSPDGALLAVGDGQDVRIIDPWQRRLVQLFGGDSGIVRQLQWHPDRRRLAAVTDRGHTTFFDVPSGKTLAEFEDPKAQAGVWNAAGDAWIGDRVWNLSGAAQGESIFVAAKPSNYDVVAARRAPGRTQIIRQIDKMGPNQFVLESFEPAGREVNLLGRYGYVPTGDHQKFDLAPQGDLLAVATGYGGLAVREVEQERYLWSGVLLPGGDFAAFDGAGSVIAATPRAAYWLCVVVEEFDGRFVTLTPAEFTARVNKMSSPPADAPSSASRPPDKSLAALEFDGILAHVVVPWTYDGKTPLTVECWATTREPRQSALIADAENSGISLGPHEFIFYDEQCVAGNRPDYARSLSNYGLAHNRRVHLAGVYDGKQIQLFVDGHPCPATPIAGAYRPSSYPMLLGANPTGDRQYPAPQQLHFGLIDEVRISTTARYREGFQPPAEFAADADTAVLYKIDEGSGQVLKDSSGNGHDGRIVEAKWTNLSP